MSFPTAQAAVEAYIEGTRTRDVALLKTVFADGAVMTGYLGPDLLHGGPEPFYGALEANEVGDDYAATIVDVTETGAIATGQLAEDNLLGLSFLNHFQLVHLPEGGWKISAKLFKHS
ncbi:MAG: nuclear transport factor 2 family protein [Pseudomonadota bacterium]